MPADLVIRGGTIVRSDRVEQADLFIENDKFVESSGSAKEEIDATGLHIFPGVIDPHVHFNEPGRTEWEGFTTGSSALAAGGGTLFFDMPLNSSPPVLDGESFDAKKSAAEKHSLTDFALWGGLTPANLDKLEELADRGVVGFKAFMCNSGIDDFSHVDDYTLYRGMQIAAKLGLIVAVHAENDTICSKLSAELQAAGRTGIADYLQSRPVIAEVEAIQRAIAFAEDTGCKLHIVHVSSQEGSWESHIAISKADVTYETCPHYVILNEADVHRLGAIAKCSPPLRSETDNRHMQYYMYSDELSFVGSDHSPAPPSMKTGDNFFKIWGGISGVQSTLNILLSLDNNISLEQISKLTSTNIPRRFDLPDKGLIAPRFDADVCLVDLNKTFTLKREDLLDRHKQSPYIGREFRGVIRRTILRGKTIFQDGKIISPPLGRFVRPNKKTNHR